MAQSISVAGTCATLQAVEDLRKLNSKETADSVNKIITSLTDALAFQGNVFSSLNICRREMLKPVFKSEFATLCNSTTKIETQGGYLFGNNLPKLMKDIKDSSQLALEFTKFSNTGSRQFTGSYRRGRGQNRFNFKSSRTNRYDNQQNSKATNNFLFKPRLPPYKQRQQRGRRY